MARGRGLLQPTQVDSHRHLLPGKSRPTWPLPLLRFRCKKKGDETIKWSKEKLLSRDPVQRCLSYEVVESNMGFMSYVATLRVFPVAAKAAGCRIEWGFVCDLVEGRTCEYLKSYIEFYLQLMANTIELAKSS
ncbi:hypothetical protein TSUD_407390 [Trifolium subterraneum]|uniref:Bet v I/Major latex protein domain-containing protein n=1 Tax=Trifolium subterraneum TaxID=3900 RepID=A0A2Z6PH41_TRISU|nr:hypothetical protein TSUD_407390 [Trifolium subterraneum]